MGDGVVDGELRSARRAHRVMVADAATAYREIAVRVLTEAGYEVLAASDGADALRILIGSSPAPELCFVELNLPKVRGLDLLRRIRGSERSSTRVVVVGESLSTGAREVIDDLDPDAVVSKWGALSGLVATADALLIEGRASVGDATTPALTSVDFWVDGALQIRSCFSLNEQEIFIIIVDEPPPPRGTVLPVRFWLPARDRLIVGQGEVSWRNTVDECLSLGHPPGMEVRFTVLGDDERRALRALTGGPR